MDLDAPKDELARIALLELERRTEELTAVVEKLEADLEETNHETKSRSQRSDS